ncbi:arf3-interacting protein [Anaeramoeba flamelloides]|uniref:Arf3-interacting protein n=1 Tax=Anaeramoeba flamelloides TaxID=1746091 RepID=A0ABQ8YTX5_9EUKA|nr:arf3-interacting protein [Anaeramoeba flamelloides]
MTNQIQTKKKITLVNNIIFGEFDALSGNTVRFQYPTPCGVSTDILEEFMIPDGLHNLDQDWTVFLLNREGKNFSELQEIEENEDIKKETEEREEIEEKENQKTFPCFVFTSTPSSKTWSALGESGNWIEFQEKKILIFSDEEKEKKPIMEIDWFQDLEIQKLEDNLYYFFDQEDLTIGFKFFDKELGEKFSDIVMEFCKSGGKNLNGSNENLEKNDFNINNNNGGSSTSGFKYFLTIVKTIQDDQATRGTRYHALAIGSQFQFLHLLKPILMLALDQTFDQMHDPLDIAKELYKSLNSIDLANFNILTEQKKQIKRIKSNFENKFKTNLFFNGQNLPLNIPDYMLEDEFGNISLGSFVKSFREQTMVVFNAILTNKRIIVLGHQMPAGTVCEYVLAILLMVCPPMRGIIRRSFPYVNLRTIDLFENLPGYIVGTTNPLFATKQRYWDVLCDLNNHKVQINSEISSQYDNAPHLEYDQKFIKSVLKVINNNAPERDIRQMFQQYTQHFINMALDNEVFVNEKAKKLETSANQSRIDIWKKSKEYQTYIKDKQIRNSFYVIQGIDVQHMIRKLRIKKDFSSDKLFTIYEKFILKINTEEECMEFLSFFSEENGGLYPLAVNLFHTSEIVRLGTVAILKRLDSIKTGSGLITGLNMFLLLAYERNVRQLGSKLEKFMQSVNIQKHVKN